MPYEDDFVNNIEFIYEKYYLEVYKFLVCFVGSREEAEDLTQDVFIKVLKHHKKFNHHSKLSTWILSIAKHTAIDYLRRKKFTTLFKQSYFNKLPDNEKQPDLLLSDSENQEVVKKAIRSLKPQYRSVVILRGVNELSIKESAEILGCSESKVKVDFHRALKILRKNLNTLKEEVFINANG